MLIFLCHNYTTRKANHRDLVHMEGTAHIDFPKFETAEAINFKILPVMHMQKL